MMAANARRRAPTEGSEDSTPGSSAPGWRASIPSIFDAVPGSGEIGARLGLMRDWTVAGGVIESDEGLLLVCNRRRNGSFDWSPPGGVIEIAEGESLLDGLTREVEEETGVRVAEWAGPLYEVRAEAVDLGWRLRAEVHVAVDYDGEIRVDDPDGSVGDARFFGFDECADQLL